MTTEEASATATVEACGGIAQSASRQVTAAFMASFYGALCRGQAPAAALHLAQTGVMRQHPHPFHWAAFVSSGTGPGLGGER